MSCLQGLLKPTVTLKLRLTAFLLDVFMCVHFQLHAGTGGIGRLRNVYCVYEL